MNADKLWHDYNRFRKRKAAQHTPAVYKALQAQIKYWAETRSIESIPMQPMADAVRDIYMDAGRLWAHRSYLNTLAEAKLKKPLQTKRMPIGFNEDFVNAILAYFRTQLLTEAVIPITETTQEWIREQLSKGIEQGFSLDEVVQQIIRSPITRHRAELIARTEVMKAANLGESIGVAKTGLETIKVWISVRDNRTRRDHILVDDQQVPSGEAFTVGPYKMQRPGADVLTQSGDKVTGKASAAQVCNCRCCIGRKVVRDADGLPLRKASSILLRP